MASKELTHEVATFILNISVSSDNGGSFSEHECTEKAEELLSTILAALQEPTREMLDELKINDAFTYQALETRWNAALNASPLGEQSE